MPLPKKKTPDWVKRSGRRQLTEPEKEKIEFKRVESRRRAVSATRAAKLKAEQDAAKKKKPKPWYKRYNPFNVLATGPLSKKE